MAPGSRSPGCSSSARRAAPTCGCSAPRMPRTGSASRGAGSTWASLRCARPYDKEGSLADQATDTASAALLRKHLDEAYRLVDWLYQDRRETDVRDIAHKALKQIKEAMLLASLPAPATDSTALLKRLRFDFIDGLDGAILPED